MLDRLEWWLSDPAHRARELLDVDPIRQIAKRARRLPPAATEVFLHGDLLPGNLVVRDGRLAALIDWGSAGVGDPAQDLAPAWTLLDEPARTVFRSELAVDDVTWERARVIELEQAVGAILYYEPRRHPLAEVGRHTLHRILTD